MLTELVGGTWAADGLQAASRAKIQPGAGPASSLAASLSLWLTLKLVEPSGPDGSPLTSFTAKLTAK